MRYLGKAKWMRENSKSRTGILTRLWEHLAWVCAGPRGEGKKKRYRWARLAVFSTYLFLILRLDQSLCR